MGSASRATAICAGRKTTSWTKVWAWSASTTSPTRRSPHSRTRYIDPEITRDAIFDYVYGVLHAPDYRARFADDLAKSLPRIPLAPEFHAFAEAGRALAKLHLGYETGPEYPLVPEVSDTSDGPTGRLFGNRSMRLVGEDDSVLVVNDRLRLFGIPADAHRYEVNGRTPLSWFIDRYRVSTDKESGITNDPNAWFPDEAAFIAAVRRIVHLSVETARIVDGTSAGTGWLTKPFQPIQAPMNRPTDKQAPRLKSGNSSTHEKAPAARRLPTTKAPQPKSCFSIPPAPCFERHVDTRLRRCLRLPFREPPAMSPYDSTPAHVGVRAAPGISTCPPPSSDPHYPSLDQLIDAIRYALGRLAQLRHGPVGRVAPRSRRAASHG